MSGFGDAVNLLGGGSGIGGLFSGIGGVIAGAFNGPGRQYRYQRKLMEKQAQLNEEAAEANHQRSLDMYNHQFETQSAWDSSSAQRARAEAAGLSKAALGAEGAAPAASATGSGASPGVSLGSPDTVGGAELTTRSLSNLSQTLLAIRDLNSQIDLRQAQTDELGSRSLMQITQSSLNDSVSALNVILADNEKIRGDLFALERDFQEQTLEDRVDMTNSQALEAAGRVERIRQEVESMKHDNNIKKLYGYKRARLECDKMTASIALTIAETHGVWSQIGLNQEQAKWYSQLVLNAKSAKVGMDFQNNLNKLLKNNMLTQAQLDAYFKLMELKKQIFDYNVAPLEGVQDFFSDLTAGAILFMGHRELHNTPKPRSGKYQYRY